MKNTNDTIYNAVKNVINETPKNYCNWVDITSIDSVYPADTDPLDKYEDYFKENAKRKAAWLQSIRDEEYDVMC